MKKFLALALMAIVVAGLATCGGATTQIGTSEDTTNRVGPAYSDITIEKQDQPVEPPKKDTKLPEGDLAKTIVFETSLGTYEVTLFGDTTIESANMLDKVNAKAYDGLTFHRVVKNFVVQGGDPAGNGTGGGTMGMSGVRTHKNLRGTIAMASSNAGKTQSDMQFFINTIDNPGLDSQGFIAFGQVTKGMEVIDAIENTPTNGETPKTPVLIKKAYVK